jgi:GNAT superfamily N-acetyltransferase
MGPRIDEQVTAADEAAVKAGLLAFNEARLGAANLQPLNVVARTGDAVVGGLLGVTRWNWLYVDKLWVAESQRGSGVGRALMERAETIARSRGCTHVSLDTFEFQARPFYEKLGYQLFGTLEGYPPRYRQYYLWKAL